MTNFFCSLHSQFFFNYLDVLPKPFGTINITDSQEGNIYQVLIFQNPSYFFSCSLRSLKQYSYHTLVLNMICLWVFVPFLTINNNIKVYTVAKKYFLNDYVIKKNRLDPLANSITVFIMPYYSNTTIVMFLFWVIKWYLLRMIH